MKFKVVLKSVFLVYCCFSFFVREAQAACQAESCPCGSCSTTTTIPNIRCGNGDCQMYAGENHQNCPQDCSATATCGDGVISSGETCQNCPADVKICGGSCGDKVCSSSLGETCSTCPGDCGECSSCGDTVCSSSLGESCSTCPGDCGSCGTCGNGICNCAPNGTETSANCPQDCGVPTTTTTTTVPTCGNGICNCSPNGTETSTNCPQDCGVPTTTTTTTVPQCGNGVCNGTENSVSCPQDCGFPTTTTTTTTTTSTTTTTTSTTTTTINQCSFYYKGVVRFDHNGGDPGSAGQVGGTTISESLINSKLGITQKGLGLSCLTAFRDRMRNGSNILYTKVAFIDDTIAFNILLGEQVRRPGSTFYLGKFLTNNTYHCGVGDRRVQRGPLGQKRPTLCASGTVYFDANCNAVTAATARAACGSIVQTAFDMSWISNTPISLIWDESYDYENNLSIVDFPLNPNSKGKSQIWKASAKTPLLVYDPEHSGKIDSATQLFGNWTFGGKRVASLLQNNNAPQPWTDGYEALASLDANYDAKISAEELKPLALWFDNNQNGVSEKGEVIDLETLKVISLGFKVDKIDSVTKSRKVSFGYERMVGDKTIHGASVDWYGEESTLAQDLLMKYSLNTKVIKSNSLAAKENAIVKEEIKDQKPIDVSSLNTKDAFQGKWIWKYKNNTDAKSEGNGFMIFSEADENSELAGISMLEIPIASANDQLRSMVQINKFIAAVSKENNLPTLRFAMGTDSMTLINKAVLSADGKTIAGESVVENLRTDGQTTKLKYQWTAERAE